MANCCDFLIAEHRQTESGLRWLEERLAALSGASPVSASSAFRAKEADWLSVAEFYAGWASDLYRHFVLEEEALFSLVSQYRSMMLMTVEHDDLLTLQAAFEGALTHSVSSGSAHPDLMRHFQAFQTRLQAHIVEEERGIFPLAQACLLPEEHQLALRRYQEISEQATPGAALSLLRPEPAFQVIETAVFDAVEKPLSYETLYEREHASVQHIRLQAGMKQALHWVGPHQCLFLLSGTVTLETRQAQIPLSPGQCVTLDSQLYFALQAHTDAHLLNFRVWPHPHYTKVSGLSQATGRKT
jgi:hemerythrin-like domain-containing protein/mannose-6-phosphate isomerase-like protein (cupin superfamily)